MTAAQGSLFDGPPPADPVAEALIAGAVGRRHPATSHAAANAEDTKRGNRRYRQQILVLMLERGDHGLTAAEAGAAVGISTQLAGSRFQELRAEGKNTRDKPVLAVRTDRTRVFPGGKAGLVHVLTPAGVAEARRLAEGRAA